VSRVPRATLPIALAAAGLLLAATASPQGWTTSDAVGLGPLLLRSQSPLSLLRYSPTPLAPVTTAKGEWYAGGLANWNNYYAYDPDRYVIDVEMLGVTLGASYGISDRVDVSATVPISYRGGGALDPFIERFEKAIGVPNEKRLLRPRNAMEIRIAGNDGAVFERSGGDAGWGLEDANLAVRYQLSRGDRRRPAVLLGLGLNLPIGRQSSLRSSGGVDVATGIAVGQRLSRRFHLYGTASVTRHATTEVAGVELTRLQWQLFGGVELRTSEVSSWLLQGMTISKGADEFGAFSKATHEVTFGYKRMLRDNLLVEVSILENLFVFDNSPDVGFHVGLVWRSRQAGSRGAA
jgi:hypothetical protein